ncbi:hypothetical protein Desdi_1798 [Desulfitobacterium dichloroeliminans LMG P-21439]|uniref:Uncharacterized protein n=1 Tax=Desulfitobacterium dichloroeliminans (strain LMG P-21439 / DCA1) TaxID=871963 RepID=L0F5Y5_DESDL|nr:hypothetical protein [Desulfitobacterium dichloroeliminans]AGA69249.1 hypothetical protein Desdi_1798 [Desulfitobacterium dichloroeliminans LMG P-21439]
MRLISNIPQYQFQTTIHPDCLPEPEEIGERALLIKEVTGSSDQPYTLKMEDPQEQDPITLIPYYEAARKHQLLTKIEYPKDSWQWEESQQRFVPVTVEKK